MKERLRIKIFNNSTVQTFLYRRAKNSNRTLLLFQETKAGTDHLTGIVITATLNTILNKILEMRTKSHRCRFHINSIIQLKVTNIS